MALAKRSVCSVVKVFTFPGTCTSVIMAFMNCSSLHQLGDARVAHQLHALLLQVVLDTHVRLVIRRSPGAARFVR